MASDCHGQGEVGERRVGKLVFLLLSNLSGQRLKAKESNIIECWCRFKPLAFLRLTYHVILAQHTHSESSAVLLVRVAQWIKKTIPEFFNLLFYWSIGSRHIKVSFYKCIKSLDFQCLLFCSPWAQTLLQPLCDQHQVVLITRCHNSNQKVWLLFVVCWKCK